MAGAEPSTISTADGSVYVLACGALACELTSIVALNQIDAITIEYLPAKLHNRPEQIPDLVAERLTKAAGSYGTMFVAYGDCGTGGRLDTVLERHGAERLPGDHCYEFFALDTYRALRAEEIGTFYLTDYLARHFDRLVWRGLGIDRHPELLPLYFGNYRKLAYVSQTVDPALVEAGREAAERLGLAFEHHHVGFGDLESTIVSITRRVA